jgi:hypothetical protein
MSARRIFTPARWVTVRHWLSGTWVTRVINKFLELINEVTLENNLMD